MYTESFSPQCVIFKRIPLWEQALFPHLVCEYEEGDWLIEVFGKW